MLAAAMSRHRGAGVAAARRWGVAAALLAAACQPLPHPFANSAGLPGTPAPIPSDSLGIVVEPVAGVPSAPATALAKALAKALRDGDVPASRHGHNRRSFYLVTNATAAPLGPDRAAITLDWQVRAANGRLVGSGTARQDGSAALWRKGDAAFATALAGAAAPAIVDLVAGNAPLPVAVEPAVTVGRIAGAPGDGAVALERAIAMTLPRAGVDVAHGAEKARFTLSCKIEVRPAPGDQQHIAVHWVLASAKGARIGVVTQEHTLPRGALDNQWGEIAYAVASAAAPGIAQLVQRATLASEGG